MGCNNCKSKSKDQDILTARISDYIQRDDHSHLDSLLKLYCLSIKSTLSSTINSSFLPHGKLMLSPLSFSVFFGSSRTFQYLLNQQKASLEAMHINLLDHKLDPMIIICESGHLDLLKVYLPHYLSLLEPYKQPKISKNSFSNNHLKQDLLNSWLPIHSACKYNFLNIIQYFHNFFLTASVSQRPLPLDPHAIDWLTGENCALISVRNGNFVMMKMLFEVVHADFHLKNNQEEGAMQILAGAAKPGCCIGYFECAMYLIDVIKIDITYNYRETFRLLENGTIRKFLNERLQKLEICVDDEETTCKSEIQNEGDMKIEKGVPIFLRNGKDLSSIIKESSGSWFSDSIIMKDYN